MESEEAAEEMKDTPNKDPVFWLWRGKLGAAAIAVTFMTSRILLVPRKIFRKVEYLMCSLCAAIED